MGTLKKFDWRHGNVFFTSTRKKKEEGLDAKGLVASGKSVLTNVPFDEQKEKSKSEPKQNTED